MTEPNAELRILPLTGLAPHPGNPRLLPREDVIDRIAAEIIAGGFGHEHALLVRPLNGGHQIISGHHRAEAAKLAGLDEVPCWVRDLSDDEAFMQLVLANTQGELSPLEIGIHALGFKRGGQAEYAERLGRTKGWISQVKSAAEVAKFSQLNFDLGAQLIDKATHLYEISRAPRESWPFLVERLLAKGWSVSDTASQVEKVRKFDIPAEHAYWLPFAAVVEEYLRRDRLNPAAVAKLVSTADGVFAYIGTDGTDEDHEAFATWLQDHAGNEAWDARAIGRYHADLIREVAERRAAEAEAAAVDAPRLPEGVTLLHRDFREFLDEPGELEYRNSVDAIITDPPYPEEFLPLFADLCDMAKWVLKPGGICAVMAGQSYLPRVMEEMHDSQGSPGSQVLRYHWTLAYLTPGGQAVQVWPRKVNTFWKPVLVYVKGDYAGNWLGDVASSDVNDNDKQHHHWGQSESGMADLIERLTKPGQLVCDPFLGGGTTAVAAHALGRRFVGCDIDEDCIARTTARFTTDEDDAA